MSNKPEFGAQFRLLAQSIDSALERADTPEQCDDALTRLLAQLENWKDGLATTRPSPPTSAKSESLYGPSPDANSSCSRRGSGVPVP